MGTCGRWYPSGRHAMGLLGSANAAGQLIFLPLLGRLSQDYGWQSVSIAVARAGAAARRFGVRCFSDMCWTSRKAFCDSSRNPVPLRIRQPNTFKPGFQYNSRRR